MPYRSLDARKIIETLGVLHQRIEERFPDAGLGRVAAELVAVAQEAERTVGEIGRPIILLRVASGLLIALIGLGLGLTLYQVTMPRQPLSLTELVQVMEAGINDVVLLGIAVFFVVSLERRHKRRRVLAALHELRSLAHVVDMHQLTKDPAPRGRRAPATPSSPRRPLPPEDLARYLDYCAELLALTGKVAALFVARFDDATALAAVGEIETLTAALAGKIWQKIAILQAAEPLPGVS